MIKRILDDKALKELSGFLHELYFEIPHKGFEPTGGLLSIVFEDRLHLIDKETHHFRLEIHDVVATKTHGNVANLPGNEARLNYIRYDARKRMLKLKAIHPYEIDCVVENLCLYLDQVD